MKCKLMLILITAGICQRASADGMSHEQFEHNLREATTKHFPGANAPHRATAPHQVPAPVVLHVAQPVPATRII